MRNNIYVIVENFINFQNFFDYPVQSAKFKIFQVRELSGTFDAVQLHSIKNKCACLPLTENNFVIFPLYYIQGCLIDNTHFKLLSDLNHLICLIKFEFESRTVD